jgi:hypothetical protein
VSPDSQGFRIDNLPSATAPVWQVVPTYQIEPPQFTTMQQKLDPIPDSFSRYFERGLQYECLESAPNAEISKKLVFTKDQWLNALEASLKQGDRELNAFSLQPAGTVVEPTGRFGGPITADRPWG